MSDNQKGITILISLFLFMLLSIFALNMAQMIATDTKVITEDAGGNVTRHLMGPKKESERLQAIYLALGGLHHNYDQLVAFQRCTEPNVANCNIPSGDNSDDVDPTKQTGFYVTWYSSSTGYMGGGNAANTLLQDINSVSQAQLPNGTNMSTTLELEQQFWRSTRVYEAHESASTPPSGDTPVDLIDESDTAVTCLYNQSCGLDQDMGPRSSTFPYSPPTNASTTIAMNLGNSFVIAGTVHRFVVIDFGMEVDFDELRWLNRSGNYTTQMDVHYWNSDAGRFIGASSPLLYPNPASTSNGERFVPYYFSCTGGVTNNNVYNGDRCTNFLGAGTPSDRWFYIPSTETPCTVAANQCRQGSSGGAVVTDTSNRSYIARYRLASPLRTTRVMLHFVMSTSAPPGVMEELGVYCCGNYGNTYPPPAYVRPVLKETHGVIRTGYVYRYNTANPTSPPALIYLNTNVNATTVSHEGELHRDSHSPSYE